MITASHMFFDIVIDNIYHHASSMLNLICESPVMVVRLNSTIAISELDPPRVLH
jgi:hypothetical protein